NAATRKPEKKGRRGEKRRREERCRRDAVHTDGSADGRELKLGLEEDDAVVAETKPLPDAASTTTVKTSTSTTHTVTPTSPRRRNTGRGGSVAALPFAVHAEQQEENEPPPHCPSDDVTGYEQKKRPPGARRRSRAEPRPQACPRHLAAATRS
ncbi:unnamed protein product, partial [Urochloa humidicola]